MAGAAKPMGTSREGLWLLGLAAFLLVPAVAWYGFGVGGGPDDPVAFQVADDESLAGVEVTVNRTDGEDPVTVQRVRIREDRTDARVYETTTRGSYAVTVTADGSSCRRTVRVRSRDGTPRGTVRRPADGDDCPVSFSVG
jgi:hypothetical protein